MPALHDGFDHPEPRSVVPAAVGAVGGDDEEEADGDERQRDPPIGAGDGGRSGDGGRVVTRRARRDRAWVWKRPRCRPRRRRWPRGWRGSAPIRAGRSCSRIAWRRARTSGRKKVSSGSTCMASRLPHCHDRICRLMVTHAGDRAERRARHEERGGDQERRGEGAVGAVDAGRQHHGRQHHQCRERYHAEMPRARDAGAPNGRARPYASIRPSTSSSKPQVSRAIPRIGARAGRARRSISRSTYHTLKVIAVVQCKP